MLVRRGLEAAERGALGEAAELLRKALEAAPNDAATWNSLGVVLVRQGEWKDGVEAFKRAVRLEPRLADARRNLAVALDRRGRTAEAIAQYRSFLALAGAYNPERETVERRLRELTARAAGPGGEGASR